MRRLRQPHGTHLDARDEDLLLRRLLDELGGLAVNGEEGLGVDGAALVDRLPNDVEDAPQRLTPHGHLDGRPRVHHELAPRQALRPLHGDAPHRVLPQVLGHLEHQADLVVLHLQARHNGGQLPRRELDVHHGTHHLRPGGGRGRGIAHARAVP